MKRSGSLSFCTSSCNQWSCCCKRLCRPPPVLKHIQLKAHGFKNTLLTFQPFVFYIPIHSLKTNLGTMYFFPPTSSYSALQLPHDRTPVWQLLAFFLVWESLESCSLAQGETQRYHGVSHDKNSIQFCSVCVTILSVCPHFPV